MKKSLVFLSNTVHIFDLVACSSFVQMAFTPFNSMETLFSYGMCYNKLPGKTLKLDALKEMGKSVSLPGSQVG